MNADLPHLETAIKGIERMTAELEWLREVRRDYVHTYGPRQSRQTFEELDRSLRALRKAAR